MASFLESLFYVGNSPADSVYMGVTKVWGAPVDPVSVPLFIYDTDMATDVDDLLATRLLGNYVRAGEAECIAAVVSTRGRNATKTTKASLVLEGMPNVPLGRATTSYADRETTGGWHNEFSSLWTLSDAQVDAMESSTITLRRALSAVPDNSVDYLVVGHLGPVHGLLESSADGFDPRNGKDLFGAKIRHLWVMGGSYPSGSEHNFNVTTASKAASHYVFTPGNLPSNVPVTLLGFGIGDGVKTGQFLPDTDVVRQAYIRHGSSLGRSSWDPMLVELAVSGGNLAANGYSSVQGTVTVSTTGSNTWANSVNGPHRYVTQIWTDAQFEDYLNPLCYPSDYVPPDPDPDPPPPDPDPDPPPPDPDPDPPPPDPEPNPDPTMFMRLIPPSTFTEDQVVTSVGPFVKALRATSDVILQTKGGKPAFYFDGFSWFETEITDLTSNFTVYASFWLDNLPSSTTGKAGIVMHDAGGTAQGASGRAWHMPIRPTGEYVPASFSGSSGADHVTGLNATTGQWEQMVLRREGNVFIPQLNANTSTFTRTVNVTPMPVTVGGRNQTTSRDDQLTGWISEVRIYLEAHSPAQIATVQAEMASN